MTNTINKMVGRNGSGERSTATGVAFHIGGASKGRGGRGSPARPQQSSGRGSPRYSPQQQLFAGAKWTEPPAATALPSPPVHWTQAAGRNTHVPRACIGPHTTAAVSVRKPMLKSQA